MCRVVGWVGVLLLGLPGASASSQGLPWEVWASPSRIAELDAADLVLERSSHCLDGCRYDRSNPGSENDNRYPERWLYRDGAEVVVFDEAGPGAITRLWVTTGQGGSQCIDPQTRVRFYFGAAIVPALDLPLASLFDGSTPPFTAPLVADPLLSSGGYVSYVPVTYASSLRIALSDAENGGINPCNPADPSRRPLWFQVQHHRLPPGTVLSDAVGDGEVALRAFLAHAGDDPWNGLLAPEQATTTLPPGASVNLMHREGMGWLRGLRLNLPRSAWNDVRLRIVIDAEPTVDLTLADFFASPVDASVPSRGVFVGSDADGWLYAWFPMPYAQSLDLTLAADPDSTATIAVDSAISVEDTAVPVSAGRFQARLADGCVAGGSFELLADEGAGKLVGLSARYEAGSFVADSPRGFLEGDERFFVDDAIAPAWYGTGVEDFYNSGFYFDAGAYAAALSGATQVDADAMPYTTTAYRWLATDALTYAGAARLTEEAGSSPADPRALCVHSVAYVYRRARRSIVGYDGFEIGDVAAATAHGYAAPAGSRCATLASAFEDEPPTARAAVSCRYETGYSRFHLRTGTDATAPLRLRRTFDAGCDEPEADCLPGTMTGAAAADVVVAGRVAGTFPVAAANPVRRWQAQEIVLDPAMLAGAGAGGMLDIEIVPRFAPFAPAFTESAWMLSGGWRDPVFSDGFDSAASGAAE